MKPAITTEAVILSETKYSESSKILRAYTREIGKVSIMAKGALRPKSKLVTFSQPHCHFLCKLTQGKNFYYIEPINIIDSNFSLRREYNTIVLAGFISEMVDKSFLEGETNKTIFDLIVKTLKLMNQNKNVEALVLAFSLKYISYMGYRPNLKEVDEAYFSNHEGGVTNLGGVALNIEDIYYLKKLLYTSLDEIVFEYDKSRTLFLLNLVADYIKYNLEIHEFNSLKIL
ncbi:DNA replication and repair protein RecO [Peptoniphilus asaccharolyticus DSM 20463]|uniref:DNA repair protein RecO n=1 Tax=Peptoniphilus asaccharolyticus DSM 20463 TaxID=573058 RepID=A0A1W1UUM8_PEPAS|nr:DNA repair protein RecO [Peptoniphilus asaccharolyticus]MBL7575182.1 DNA repair protein RecO [Peptoniphilus asaccharolyticus]SMB84521.1 DNA replication and repair protein RecO [Peptoniphilus asaccharolyticus DSM 20463]